MNNKSNVSRKIRKGDKVVAIAGNYRGQVGTVLSQLGEKVIVQGLNIRKKHIKKSQMNPNGGIVELERPIHISNVSVCNAEGKPLKLKTRTNTDGKRELFYKDGEQEIVYRVIKHS